MRPQPPMVGLGEASPLHRPQGAAVMAAHRTRRLLKGWSVGRREAIRIRPRQAAALMAAHRIRRLWKVSSAGQREAIRIRRPTTLARHPGATIACELDLQGSSAILHCLMVRLTKAVAAG
jgi:hypothetical protein